MRLSMDKSDRAHDPDAGSKAKVFLDGVEQKHCLTADEEEGLCVLYATDGDGRLVINGDSFVKIERKGNVRIVLNALKSVPVPLPIGQKPK